ncbi:MAG: protein kinase [Verrucomicrobia bacterium]|nr:protein kinase [Verrucomicrobiota bacterium]
MKAGLGTQAPPPADSPTLKPGGTSAASDSTAPSVAEVAKLFPQLEIIELLGAGGMGAVYKARQPQLDRIVALKIMRAEISRNPAFAERFAREARALAKLNHPNIVSLYDFGQTGEHCYFIMEFMDGANLRSVMRAGKMSPREALGIVPKVCEALQFAHDEGLVHRDIKPENILLDTRGRVKIADFGLAKLVGRDVADFTLTATGMTLGTPRYMAPEQFEKPQEVDHRADIYSLGVVLYEMLTGELPMGRFPLPSQRVQMDVRIDEVVLRTLEKDVNLRYQAASEMRTDVESISGVIEKLPPTMRHAFGFDYKSKTELFGLPLVNICSGTDPTTGRVRIAKGIIAIGDKAKGVIALGGVATGVFAFGGVAIGVFAFGGSALGVFSFGGLALALVFAIGGLAAAPYVFAGIGIGYVAVGGMMFGVHTAGGNADDPVAKAFFVHFRLWHLWFTGMGLSLLSIPASFGAQAWARRRAFISPRDGGGGFPPARGSGVTPARDARTLVTPVAKTDVPGASSAPSSQPDFRQQDAREILAVVMNILTGLSIVGYVAALIGLARVLLPEFRSGMESRPGEPAGLDVFCFASMLALSLMALFLLPKARRQGRDRLARINASNLIIVGVLLTVACNKHLFGPVPVWLGGIYSVIAFVCWIVLHGKDVKAAFVVSGVQPDSAAVHREGKRLGFIVVGATMIAILGAVGIHELRKGSPRSEQQIFYTFAHMDDFVRGPDGPQFSKSKIKQLGLTPAQAPEVNRNIPKYYAEFVALERQHTKVTTNDLGHLVITISPFREETIALAKRLNDEVRGMTGKDIIHLDWQGNLRAFGLFRHCGETTVTAELWKETAKAWSTDSAGGTYHFEEKHADNSRSRGGGGDNWQQVIPEEYWTYWNEK